MRKCPKCGSTDVMIEDFLGEKILVCNHCGYDESDVYNVFPEGKSSQKAKGRFSPYKHGGGKRSSKIKK